MNRKLFYKIGIICGLIPLVIGLLTFLGWWASREFFAFDAFKLEIFGFYWILISFVIALIGILLLLISLIKFYPVFLKQSLIGLIIIFLNIPTVNWILSKQGELANRAYVKIYNKGAFDLTNLVIENLVFSKEIGNLKCLSSKVISYTPKDLNDSLHRSYPNIDTVRLIANERSSIITYVFPEIGKGQCKKLYIDKEDNILEEW